MRTNGLLLLALSGLLLQGCVVVAAAAGAGGGLAGANYMQEGERTFTAPIEEVREAARQSLTGLDMTINEDSVTTEGRRLRAATWDRTVRVDLENVTYNTTKMIVSVTKTDSIIKDHTTEQQILAQVNQALTAGGPKIGNAQVER